jgi:hypothetical protein
MVGRLTMENELLKKAVFPVQVLDESWLFQLLYKAQFHIVLDVCLCRLGVRRNGGLRTRRATRELFGSWIERLFCFGAKKAEEPMNDEDDVKDYVHTRC